MCEDCFPDGFPEEIKRWYKDRNWVFKMEREPKGTIRHLIFVRQPIRKGLDYWKGLEQCVFDKEDKRIEYRACYWANRGKGWKWGQFATFYPDWLFSEVMRQAKAKQWLLT